MIDDYYISEIRILLRFTPYIIPNSSKFFTSNIRLNKIKLLIKIFFFAGIYILLWSRYIQDVFRYTLPVLKNCSAITTQRAVTASSSLNVIINNSYIATTAAFEVIVQKWSLKEAQCIEIFDLENKKIYTLYLTAEKMHLYTFDRKWLLNSTS